MFSFILSLLVLAALVPAAFFVVECLGGMGQRTEETGASAMRRSFAGTIAIIVPAHNEAGTIEPTLRALLAQRRETMRLIVVADNCTDETTEKSRQIFDGHSNTDVLERQNTDQRGKGYALAFGLDALRERPVDIVVFVDADCLLGERCLERIIQAADDLGRPAQALYLMDAPTPATPGQSIAAFAWLVMNKIRMRGLFRLFDVTRLTGSGMAFPYPVLRDHFEGTGDIVEDLGLTVHLVRRGYAPVLVENAVVTSTLPATDSAATTQRARWEHGALAVAKREAVGLALAGLRQGELRLTALAFDIAIPPLVLLISGLVVLVALTSLMALTGIVFPAILASVGLIGLLVIVAIVWARHGRKVLPAAALRGVPGFILNKTKIHGREGRRSTKTWTRTQRDP
ncbi:MAG: glycosyltransferase family 2 protein [Pseudomonadota bacterium]